MPHLPPGYLPQQPSMESLLHYQQQLQQHLLTMQGLAAHQSEPMPIRPNWLDFALYFSRNGSGAAVPTPMMSPSPIHPHLGAQHQYPGGGQCQSELSHSPAISPVSHVGNEEKSSSSPSSAAKCRSFTIDAILGK